MFRTNRQLRKEIEALQKEVSSLQKYANLWEPVIKYVQEEGNKGNLPDLRTNENIPEWIFNQIKMIKVRHTTRSLKQSYDDVVYDVEDWH